MGRMEEPVKRRRYDAPARRAQAGATRERILDAAAGLFLTRGYHGTTTAQIGRAAGTSEASVFSAFGSKAELLVATVAHQASGPDADPPLRARPEWAGMGAREAIVEFARTAARAHERSWRLLRLVSAAAEGDPVLAEAAAGGGRRRYADCTWFVREIIGLPADRVEAGADATWTLIGVDVYRALVVDRGWAPERYETWLARMLEAALLDG